ncbi:sodium/potassium/calcium exchanger 3-like [Musca domestica]|uniref:Sodium/potassium/calcium exchanger 3-like n=1 Tax=Musca domestica TaxID=7370 RepID=A0A1I8MU67_MUSDO|nr:sodium/potassium/calcium exchanger 3-like [Musca domestica]XP_058978356.1 sodium/potassium/calcium exchanger 3-like [Musca domestica]
MAFTKHNEGDVSLILTFFHRNHDNIENCTISGIDAFPNWFTEEGIRYDYVLICFVINMYLFLGVAIVCDEYCVPSVERLCYKLGMSYDVAGATFLAVATSAPEFFVNFYATFLTEGDMGIGTIVGSSTFNSLAITAFCGFSAGMVGFSLDWWPLTRDLLWNTLNIILLAVFMFDGYIFWYEAAILFFCFLSNIINLSLDGVLQKQIRDPEKSCPCVCFIPRGPVQDFLAMLDPDNSEEKPFNFCHWPIDENSWAKLIWCISYPLEVLMFLTIPNVRRHSQRKCYLLGLVMSIVWISLLTYLISWMLTVVGYYLQIPDSIMGITILAIGTSIPEAISSVIVTKKGYGSMAVCNAVGSNNFNISFCLSVPWLFKTIFMSSSSAQHHAVAINSASIFHSTVILVSTCFILYGSFLITRFQLGFGVAIICLLSYLIYIVLAITLEMYVFGSHIVPHCPHKS